MKKIVTIVFLFSCLSLCAQRVVQSNSSKQQTIVGLKYDILNLYTFNNYVYNLNVSTNKSFSFQFSQGFTRLPQDINANENIIRTTASLQNVFRVSRNTYFASSIMIGINSQQKHSNEEHAINARSLAVQGDFNIKRFAVYGRFESIQRLFSQLSLPGGSSKVSFTLNSISLGTSFRLFYMGPMDLRIGGHCTAALQPNGFNIFNGRAIIRGQFYIRMTPLLMSMHDVKKAGRDKKRMRSM